MQALPRMRPAHQEFFKQPNYPSSSSSIMPLRRRIISNA